MGRCSRRSESAHRVPPLLLWLLTGLLLASGGAGAEPVPAYQGGVELTAPTQRILKQLSEGSVQWQKAFIQEDPAAADAEVQAMLAIARKVGFDRLPDLNVAALARAVEAAEQGDFTRAAWALEAAKQLDPGRPGTAFAEASVHRLRGEHLAALTDSVRGYLRLFTLPTDRTLWTANLVLWAILAAIIGGALFVVLLIALRGREVTLDLVDSLAERLPRALAWMLALALLVGTLLLPYGLVWFLLTWMVLLWSYSSLSERVVLVLVLIVVGSVPFWLPAQRTRVALALSPPVRAIHGLAEGRLYGRLFTDLGVLLSVLPGDPAVHHVLADLHRVLDQWEPARTVYADLLESEPENSSALIALGIYFYRQDDFGRAAEYFERAAEVDPESAVAYFNLSQAYNSEYLYEDSRRALQSAQELRAEEVGGWIQEAIDVEVRAVDGGIERLGEIEQALRSGAQVGGAREAVLLRRGFTAFIVVGVILMAVALHLARRGGGLSSPPSGRAGSADAGDLLLRVLIPGLASLRNRAGVPAYLALLPPVALLLLPFSTSWGYAIPWGFAPGGSLIKVVTTLGLVVYLLLRLMQQSRAR